MKKVKLLSIILFLLSLLIFIGACVRQWIQNQDESPVISSTSDSLKISVHYQPKDLLKGITAHDKEDGDLTNKVITGQISRFIKSGSSTLTYTVFDSHQNSGTYKRKIIFKDYTSPKVSLEKPLVFGSNEGSYKELQQRIHFKDSLEGDISSWMKVGEEDVQYGVKGTYKFEVSVSNSLGDTVTYALPVHIIDKSAFIYDIIPAKNVIYVKKNEQLSPRQYISKVKTTSGNLVSSSLVKYDEIETNKKGIKEIHYYIKSGSKTIGETYVTIIVEETNS